VTRTTLAIIGDVEKNGRQNIRVTLEKFSGVKHVVLQVIEPTGVGVHVVAKRSVELNVARIDALIEALQKARDVARQPHQDHACAA